MIYINHIYNHVYSLEKNFTFEKGLSLLLIRDNSYFINYKDVCYIYPKGEDWSYLPKILSVLPKNPNLVNLLLRLRKVCHTIYVSSKYEDFEEIDGKWPISSKPIMVRFEYCESDRCHTIHAIVGVHLNIYRRFKNNLLFGNKTYKNFLFHK